MSALPPGFVVDSSAAPAQSGLPAGFQIDAPATFDQRFAPAVEQPLQQREAPSAIDKAIEPITSYPSTYAAMNKESRDLMSEGVEQAQRGTVSDALLGAGKTALGGVGYVASPINAAIRTLIGKPVEENTGIPKEYTEFAAGMALPIPKRLPVIGRGGQVAERGAPTAEELTASYLAAKNSPEVAAVQIKPQSMAKAADEISVKLNTEWLDPQLSPQTFRIVEKLNKPVDGSTVTMQNADSARRLLNGVAGGQGPDAAAARIAKKELDNWIAGVKPDDVLAGDPARAQEIMQAGRQDYAAAKLGTALDKKIAKAELQNGATNSGLNLQNQLRQKVNQFLQNDESASITKTERATMEAFVKGTTGQNTLRFVGKYLGGGGGLGSLASTSAGIAAAPMTGGLSLALPAAGFGLTKLSSVLTSRQAESLSEMIRSRSPLGKQLASPVQKFDTMALDYAVDPTTKNLARLTIASRNLSTNLKDAGISLSATDIMKSLQGPMDSSAGQEQPGTVRGFDE